MNHTLKKKWIKALRSGKYKQGKNRLRSLVGEKYCCLGVLCDVSGLDWEESISECKRFKLKNSKELPTGLADIFFNCSSTTAGPIVEISGAKTCLAAHNDNGATFSQIADAIEEQL